MLARTLPALAALVLAVALPAVADDWPQWRGPDRTGVSKETGLLGQWPKDGPALAWHAKGAGRGYASVAVVGGKVFTLGDAPSTADDKDEYVTCFDDARGKQLWAARVGPAWNRGQPSWQSSRSTPTVDGARLYVLTPHGDLVCLETDTGKENWRKNLQKDFGGQKGDGWGYSESVLVDGDRVVCTPGGPRATMVALDRKTGETVWKAASPGDRGAGHASIVPSDVGGTRVYVQTTAGGALGVRARDGKVLWTYGIDRTTAVVPTPIVRGDLVFFSAGYNRGGALLRQVPAGEGGVKVEEVYPLKTALNNRHGGIVLVGDYLYGDTDHGGIPFCAELMTGKVRWKQRGSGRGSAAVVAADGHLYLRFSDGVVALARATPQGYSEVSSFRIPDSGSRPSWSHPVVCNGKLYLREQDHIYCYDVRDRGGAR